jgi:hypothetical protein
MKITSLLALVLANNKVVQEKKNASDSSNYAVS